MGFFSSLFGEANKSSDNSNSLEKERQAGLQKARDFLYEYLVEQITKTLPLVYKSNEVEYSEIFSTRYLIENIILDEEEIINIAMKASYDGIKNIGLKNYDKPIVEPVHRHWQIVIKWHHL